MVEPRTKLVVSPTAVRLDPRVNVCWSLAEEVIGRVVVVPSTSRRPDEARDRVTPLSVYADPPAVNVVVPMRRVEASPEMVRLDAIVNVCTEPQILARPPVEGAQTP